MTENARTGIYVAAAAIALGLAWLAKPASPDRRIFEDSGERFFAQFDPLAARSMEITTFNQSTSRRHNFKVAQQGGRWSIPSHDGYPADAKDHLAQAAASVLDLTKGPMISDSPSQHDLYGVADPTAEKAGLGSGTRVTLQDDGGKTLVDLIIGKAVKDAEQVHYVRVPGKDRVYTAKVNTQFLTTKFEDWIERDLLKLNVSLLKDVIFDYYSVDELNETINPGERMTFHYAPATPPASGGTPPPSWTLEDLKPDETLQTQKLDDMRNALADLRIIDVHKKPQGMSSLLASTGSLQLDVETRTSLASRGYYFLRIDDKSIGLFSNEGEMVVRTSEGVEYNLRFGEVVQTEAGGEVGADSASGEQTGRFLFVTAGFNQSMIELPQYEPLPEPPAPAATTAPDATATTAPSTQPDPQHEAACEAVNAANEQKRQEYERKIKDGQDKVKDLNARFADWYYVVSDSVYQKLHLKRADIASKAGAETTAPAEPAPVPIPAPTEMPAPH